MPTRTHQRSRKIVHLAFQLRLIGVFAAVAFGSLLLQLFLLGFDLRLISQSMPEGNALEREMGGVLLRAFLVAAGMGLPVMIGVGILVSHRIAGPIYRFEQHLDAIARGEAIGPCRIRDGDEFQGLCERINRALHSRTQHVEALPRRRAA